MGAHGSKEKLHRSASERFVHTQVIERERFGSFGKRPKKEGKKFEKFTSGRTGQMFRNAHQNKLEQQLLENNSSQKKKQDCAVLKPNFGSMSEATTQCQ